MMSANNIKNVNHNREQEQDKTNVEVKCVEFQPPVDIEETKDEYILNVDMPGVDPNAIDVNLDTTEMLDVAWSLFGKYFKPEEVNIKKELVDQYWPAGKAN